MAFDKQIAIRFPKEWFKVLKPHADETLEVPRSGAFAQWVRLAVREQAIKENINLEVLPDEEKTKRRPTKE